MDLVEDLESFNVSFSKMLDIYDQIYENTLFRLIMLQNGDVNMVFLNKLISSLNNLNLKNPRTQSVDFSILGIRLLFQIAIPDLLFSTLFFHNP